MTHNATLMARANAERLERARQFLALLDEGLTQAEIADRHGISDTRVGQLLRLVLPPRTHPPQVVWTEEAMAELRRLWQSGMPTGMIGRRMGISRDAVIGKAHRMGLPTHALAGCGGRKVA